MSQDKNLKDAFYGGNFRVGQGLLTRDKSTDSNDLTEAEFENIQTWDELTDQADTGEAFDEVTDSEQAMDDCTESGVAFDVVTDKEMPMDKVTDKEVAMDKVTDKEMPMDKVTDKEMPMDKVTDKEVAMDKVTDKEMPMDKVTDKEMPMDKVTSKPQSFGIFIRSPHITDIHWTKTQSSNIFWDSYFEINFEEDQALVDNNVGGKSLRLEAPSGDDRKVNRKYNINIGFIDTLTFDLETDMQDDTGDNYARVIVDGQVVFETTETTTETVNADVSSISGDVEVIFEAERSSSWDVNKVLFEKVRGD